jgi:hypothetical protein
MDIGRDEANIIPLLSGKRVFLFILYSFKYSKINILFFGLIVRVTVLGASGRTCLKVKQQRVLFLH